MRRSSRWLSRTFGWNVSQAGYPLKGFVSKTTFKHISIDLADFTHCTSENGHNYVFDDCGLFYKVLQSLLYYVNGAQVFMLC